mgnify:CR=1 FL=1
MVRPGRVGHHRNGQEAIEVKYLVTVEVPVVHEVEAPDEDYARDLVDGGFSLYWDAMQEAVRKVSSTMLGDKWPASLGSRYDDTDVQVMPE